MSGIEIIGAVASAAQILSYIKRAISLLRSLHSELENAPSRIQQRASYLGALIDTLRSIAADDSFQTSLIEEHIERIHNSSAALHKVLQSSLQVIRGNSIKRYWRSLIFASHEKDILNTLDSIERDKSSLLICIVTVSSQYKPITEQEMSDMRDKASGGRSTAKLARSALPMRLPAAKKKVPKQGSGGGNQSIEYPMTPDKFSKSLVPVKAGIQTQEIERTKMPEESLKLVSLSKDGEQVDEDSTGSFSTVSDDVESTRQYWKPGQGFDFKSTRSRPSRGKYQPKKKQAHGFLELDDDADYENAKINGNKKPTKLGLCIHSDRRIVKGKHSFKRNYKGIEIMNNEAEVNLGSNIRF